MPSVKQLKYFEAVARFGHFGKAAEHCAVTQPALSMQIQELERELNLRLVERRPKGATLTDAGREVAQRASRILADLRDLGEFARGRAAPLSGPLDFGVIPTIAPYMLPPLLPLLRERYPSLDLRVRETQTQQLVGELLDGSLELLMLALPIDHPDIETKALLEDRFLLATPRDRRITKASPELLNEGGLLLLEEGHCLRDQALAYCRLRQVGVIDTFGATSLSTLAQMVANGMGMTLLPEISLGLETARASVRLLRFEEPEPRRVLGLAWRSTSPRKEDFAELGRLIVDALKTNSGASANDSL